MISDFLTKILKYIISLATLDLRAFRCIVAYYCRGITEKFPTPIAGQIYPGNPGKLSRKRKIAPTF